MTYDEIDPPKDLQKFVWKFFEFSVPDGSMTQEHAIVPDGAINIVCCKNPHFVWARLKGPSIEAAPVPLIHGSKYWGVRFMPYTGAVLLSVSSVKIRSQVLDLADLNPKLTTDLLQLTRQASTAADMADGLWKLFRPLMPSSEFDFHVTTAIQTVMASHGDIRMAQMAESLGVGLRQLQRKFKDLTGLTLKEFATVVRMRSNLVANLALERRGEVPADLGYVDQSHAIRESQKIMSKTPPQILAELSEIKYGKFS